MISNVIDILNSRVALSGLTQKRFGLCELVTDANGQTSPKEYCSNGEWLEVSRFDHNAGTSYWRKAGDISMNEVPGSVSCDRFIEFAIPLYLVVAVRKSVLNDNQYTPDAIATTLISDLVGNSTTLKSEVGARRAAVSVTGYDTDAESVMAREYNEVDAARLRTDYAHISINVSVAISIKSDCIPNECSPADACDRLLASLTTDELLDCILPSYDFADTATLDHLTAQQESDLEAALCTPCAAATVTIKNSAGTTIDSGSVASGGSGLFTITDSTAVVKNSAGTTLQTEAIPAEVSEDITIADTAVSNSDDSYVSVVISGVAKELPDITYTDALGVSASYPSVKNLTATRVNAMTCGNLNGEMTDAQRQVIQRVNPLKTGQTTSYRTGDDGDLEKGRLPSFTTLTCDNPFGNTNRFTDELGGQTYTNNLVCDWATGLMWYRVVASGTWAAAIDACLASTQGGYDDWYLPNIKEYLDITDFGLSAGAFTYTAIGSPSFSTGNHWSSTTFAATTANAVAPTTAGSWQAITKTLTRQYLMVRKMT